MLGLPKGVVRLETYNPQWASEFEKEKDIIQENIESYIIDIQHVGSTSIEGLISKPIIDIAIGVTSLYEGHKCIELLGQLGYEYKGHVGVSGRFFFTKGDLSNRTHHIHIEEIGSANWWNHILFRDYLRLHDDIRDEYAKLKKTLAEEYADDREIYAAKKVDFILDTVEKAKNQFYIKEKK